MSQRVLKLVRWSQTVFNAIPKRLVTYLSGSTAKCDGHADGPAEMVAGAVDEYLPAAGCADGNMFYICIKGPAVVMTSPTADATNLIAVNDFLVAMTAATSGATTSGRPFPWTGGTFTATQSTDGTLFNVMQNSIGYALSAKTTGQTNADVLVEMNIW